MAPPPFVPRDVFRLLVRLEAQKTHEVDTETLERRFRVPSGYAKDETLEQRERKAQNITPGPGAYEPPPVACWSSPTTTTAADAPHSSAIFASRAPRDPFQLEPLARRVKASPPTITTNAKQAPSPSPPPLGSFARADRGISSSVLASSPPSHGTSTTLTTTRHGPSAGVSFERAPRATHVPVVAACALGPAQYDVKRLWDPSQTTGFATPDAPTPAVFSVSSDKRELVWSPARALPSHAVPDAWNASPHYAKHKRRVQHQLMRQKKSPPGQPQQPSQAVVGVAATLQRLATSTSAPSLGTRRGKKDASTKPVLDPFDWLRQQPQGELRANALAARHGLADLVRPLTAAAVAKASATAAAGGGGGETQDANETHAFVRQQQQQLHDDDEPVGDRLLEGDRRGHGSGGGGSDARITLSCRLPGGFVVSLRLYSARRVRHLKAALVRRQTRFQNEDQFDLFVANGKPLAQPEDTLAQAGLSDRALVLVVAR